MKFNTPRSRTIRKSILFLVVLGALVNPRATYSCGPFFEETVFSYSESPNVPLERFYNGELGVLRPTYNRYYLVTAYRFLVGLDKPQRGRKPDLHENEAADTSGVPFGVSPAVVAWTKARAGLPDAPQTPPTQDAPISKDEPYQQFLNCPDNAFITASRTLDERKGKYGLTSSEVKEWAKGQDAVFANCGRSVPTVIPAVLTTGPGWLRSDRSYQTAAANFYGGNFDDAVKMFDAIAEDRSSPWSEVASYVAARAMIRKATLLAPKDQPFDKAVMAEAEARLQRILQDSSKSKLHEDTQRMLDFVRFRTHPAERAAELESAILRKDPDDNFEQNVTDFLALQRRGEGEGDLSDWLNTFHLDYYFYEQKQPQPSAEAAPHALKQWQEKASLPWLIAALDLTPANHPAIPKLLAAADKVPVRSPGYLSVRYYALRLMIGAGQKAEARKELDGILAKPSLTVGIRNLFIEERVPLATSFDDFLKYAPEMPAAAGVDYLGGAEDAVPPLKEGPPRKDGKVFLDTYAAKVFAKRLPIDLFSQAAASSSVPQSLQRDIALAAWTRAVLLNDSPVASKLVPLLERLEPRLHRDLQSFVAAPSDDEKKFAAIFLILKNPGLKPYVPRGSGRTNAGTRWTEESLQRIDDLRDNWWCASIGADPSGTNYFEHETADYGGDAKKQGSLSTNFKDPDASFPYPEFLTQPQKAEAARQWNQLTKVGPAPNYLGQQAIDWAKAHPDDKRNPEALHLAVRATRYGCTDKLTTNYSKKAFELLHQRYGKSEWAKKTKYYF